MSVKGKNSFHILLIQIVLALLASMVTGDNYFLSKSDLGNVYAKYGSPDFDELEWCLVKGNADDLIYVYCDGYDFSLVFDSESFLIGESSADDNAYSQLQ